MVQKKLTGWADAKRKGLIKIDKPDVKLDEIEGGIIGTGVEIGTNVDRISIEGRNIPKQVTRVQMIIAADVQVNNIDEGTMTAASYQQSIWRNDIGKNRLSKEELNVMFNDAITNLLTKARGERKGYNIKIKVEVLDVKFQFFQENELSFHP